MSKKGNTKKVVAEKKSATIETLPVEEAPKSVDTPQIDKTTPVAETVTQPTVEEALKDKELVMTAKMPELNRASEVLVMNRSQNTICLADGPRLGVTLAPREMAMVPRQTLDELLKNPMVRRFFDKGIVTYSGDKGSNVVSAHEAVVPQHLKDAVERHEGGSNIVAEVKKFKKDGSLKIDLS